MKIKFDKQVEIKVEQVSVESELTLQSVIIQGDFEKALVVASGKNISKNLEISIPPELADEIKQLVKTSLEVDTNAQVTLESIQAQALNDIPVDNRIKR